MKQLRAVFFWAHLVAGSAAGLVILVLSLSGAALAFKPQILRAVDTAAFDIAALGRQPLAASALADAVRAERPGESVRSITLQRDAELPASAQVGASTLYLDPYTGELLGESSVRAQELFRTIENWHRWLALSGDGRETGRAVTGVANVALLFLALSGIYLWWPRGWSLRHLRPILWFRRASTGRARDFNWHNVAGIWMAPMIVVMTATGAVMSYSALNSVLQQMTGGATGEGSRPGAERGRPAGPARGGRPGAAEQGQASVVVDDAVVDAAVSEATARQAEWSSMAIEMPRTAGATLAVMVSTGGATPGARSQLEVDATSGSVIRWQPPVVGSLFQRVRSWVRFAHTGEQWGVPGQALAGLACLGSALLVWTGLSLALRRLLTALNRNRASAAPAAATVRANAA